VRRSGGVLHPDDCQAALRKHCTRYILHVEQHAVRAVHGGRLHLSPRSFAQLRQLCSAALRGDRAQGSAASSGAHAAPSAGTASMAMFQGQHRMYCALQEACSVDVKDAWGAAGITEACAGVSSAAARFAGFWACFKTYIQCHSALHCALDGTGRYTQVHKKPSVPCMLLHTLEAHVLGPAREHFQGGIHDALVKVRNTADATAHSALSSIAQCVRAIQAAHLHPSASSVATLLRMDARRNDAPAEGPPCASNDGTEKVQNAAREASRGCRESGLAHSAQPQHVAYSVLVHAPYMKSWRAHIAHVLPNRLHGTLGTSFVHWVREQLKEECCRMQGFVTAASLHRAEGAVLDTAVAPRLHSILLCAQDGLSAAVHSARCEDVLLLFSVCVETQGNADAFVTAAEECITRECTAALHVVTQCTGSAPGNAAGSLTTEPNCGAPSTVQVQCAAEALLQSWNAWASACPAQDVQDPWCTPERRHALHQTLRDTLRRVYTACALPRAVAVGAAHIADAALRAVRSDGEDCVLSQLHMLCSMVHCAPDADAFLQEHRLLLAQRLFNDTAASCDVERLVLQHLRAQWGVTTVTAMQGMLDDVTAAASVQQGWLQAEAILSGALGSFQPRVHCSGHWPALLPLPQFRAPPCFQRCASAFVQYYENKLGSSRVIQWDWTHGAAEVSARFAGSGAACTLSTSLLQAVLLLHFNSAQVHSPGALADATGVPVTMVTAALKPLLTRQRATATGVKKRIPGVLHCKKGPQDASGDTLRYHFNDKYTSPRKRVVVQLPVYTAPRKDTGVSDAALQRQREHQLDAAIVRIMKTRQTLRHSELLGEVVHAVRLFRPQPGHIKRRIEHLIQGDYMERQEGNRSVYVYVA